MALIKTISGEVRHKVEYLLGLLGRNLLLLCAVKETLALIEHYLVDLVTERKWSVELLRDYPVLVVPAPPDNSDDPT